MHLMDHAHHAVHFSQVVRACFDVPLCGMVRRVHRPPEKPDPTISRIRHEVMDLAKKYPAINMKIGDICTDAQTWTEAERRVLELIESTYPPTSELPETRKRRRS